MRRRQDRPENDKVLPAQSPLPHAPTCVTSVCKRHMERAAPALRHRLSAQPVRHQMTPPAPALGRPARRSGPHTARKTRKLGVCRPRACSWMTAPSPSTRASGRQDAAAHSGVSPEQASRSRPDHPVEMGLHPGAPAFSSLGPNQRGPLFSRFASVLRILA